jgi:hypothetical protein
MISELASTIPDLSILLRAFNAVNLTDVLSSAGPLDVFAPTDEAFRTMLNEKGSLGISVEQLLAEPGLVTRVLQLHVVTDGAVCEGDLSGTVPSTLAGESLDVSGDTVTAGGSAANIVGSVNAGNGVVYLIDAVLLPTPDVAAVASSSPSPSGEGQSAESLFNEIDADGDGRITEAELRADADKRGIELTDEQVQAFLAADVNGDGDVDMEEFLDSLDETRLGSRLSTYPGVYVNEIYEPVEFGRTGSDLPVRPDRFENPKFV